MELTTRFELVTSPLPRECSTPEPREPKFIPTNIAFSPENRGYRKKWSVRQGSNLRHQPWKGCTLPTELRTHIQWWREMGSNHRGQCQQIYSLPPLTTREPRLNLSPAHKLELAIGLEPTTAGLQNRCSTN